MAAISTFWNSRTQIGRPGLPGGRIATGLSECHRDHMVCCIQGTLSSLTHTHRLPSHMEENDGLSHSRAVQRPVHGLGERGARIMPVPTYFWTLVKGANWCAVNRASKTIFLPWNDNRQGDFLHPSCWSVPTRCGIFATCSKFKLADSLQDNVRAPDRLSDEAE